MRRSARWGLGAATAVALAAVAALLWQLERGGGASGGGRRRDPDRRVAVERARRWRPGQPIVPSSLLGRGGSRRVAGMVHDAAGVPVAGARVELRSELLQLIAAPPVVATTDAAGRFDLGAVAPVDAWVVAQGDGGAWAEVEIDLRQAAPVPAPDALVLVLAPCADLARGVLHDASGRPIAGAEIAVIAERDARRGRDFSIGRRGVVELLATRADASGRFSLCQRGLPLRVTADGYATVELVPPAPASELDVTLLRGASIRGVVVDEASEPVVGARILLNDLAARFREPTDATTMTDEAGRFVLTGLSPGQHEVLAASLGFEYRGRDVWLDPTQPDTEVRILLTRCRAVAGHVRDRSGAPVAGVSVYYELRESRAPEPTSSDGAFAIECVPPTATALEVRGAAVVDDSDELPDGDGDVDDLVITIEPTAAIVGRVTRGGLPVAGARVSSLLASDPNLTDADGRFRLSGSNHRADVVFLHVSAEGSPSLTKRVDLPAAGEVTVNIELVVGATVRGRLVDADGAPVRGWQVGLGAVRGATHGATHGAGHGDSLTDADGRFTIEHLEPATYDVEVRRSALDRTELHPAAGAWPKVVIDRDGQVVDLSLQSEVCQRSLSGRVVRSDGGSLAAEVSGGGAHATADRDGRFTLHDLTTGHHVLQAQAEDGAIGEVDVDGEADVALPLGLPGSLDGTLSDDPGACTVKLTGPFDRGPFDRAFPALDHSASLDDEHFHVDHLAPGRHHVVVDCDYGEQGGDAWVDIRPRETAHVAIDVTPVP